jgi:hypothetical protein
MISGCVGSISFFKPTSILNLDFKAQFTSLIFKSCPNKVIPEQVRYFLEAPSMLIEPPIARPSIVSTGLSSRSKAIKRTYLVLLG